MTTNRTCLRVIILENEPWARIRYQNGQTQVEGPLQTILQSISSVVGFSYTFVRSIDGKWGRLSGSGYTGMVGMLHRDEADFGLGPFTVTEERFEVIHYTHPIFFDVNSILSSHSSLRNYEFRAENIFTYTTWLAVVVTFAMLNVVAIIASRVLHLSYPDYVPVHLFLASLLGRSLPRLPGQWNCRLLFGLWLIFCTFLYHFFLCQILSSIASKETHNVDNLSDLLDNEFLAPVVEYGSANEARIMSSTEPIGLSLMKRIQERHSPSVNVNEIGSDLIMDCVQNGEYAVIAQRYFLATIVAKRAPNCAYHISGEDVGIAMMAMATNKKLKKSIITAIDNWSARLMESGLHVHWLFKSEWQAASCFVQNNDNILSQIKLSSLKLPFSMWIVGVCSSFTAFLCEYVYHACTCLTDVHV